MTSRVIKYPRALILKTNTSGQLETVTIDPGVGMNFIKIQVNPPSPAYLVKRVAELEAELRKGPHEQASSCCST